MTTDLAVIGGLGLSLLGLAERIETPYGEAMVMHSRIKDCNAIFVARHGKDHIPPHKVNYCAIIDAIRKSGATRVISVNTVGSMAGHPAGSIFFPNDFVEFTKSRPNTFFENNAVHVDMSEPYCPEIRYALLKAANELEISSYEGVYVCSEGPHLESPAQIRFMQQFGDVVGMTGYPEVVLAREAGLCYASMCIVTNPASGIAKEMKLSIKEICESIESCGQKVLDIIDIANKRIPAKRGCRCRDSRDDGLLQNHIDSIKTLP